MEPVNKAFKLVEKMLADNLSPSLAYVSKVEIKENGKLDGSIRIASESEEAIKGCLNIIRYALSESNPFILKNNDYIDFYEYCPREWRSLQLELGGGRGGWKSHKEDGGDPVVNMLESEVRFKEAKDVINTILAENDGSGTLSELKMEEGTFWGRIRFPTNPYTKDDNHSIWQCVTAVANEIKEHHPDTHTWTTGGGYGALWLFFRNFLPNQVKPSPFPATMTTCDGRKFNVKEWAVITTDDGERAFQAYMKEVK
jgi:hypothetical protein